MKGIAVTTVFIIVFLLIVAALLANIIFSSQGILEGGTFEKILEGIEIPVPIESDPVGTLELTQPPTPEDQVTSTQIACNIALALRDDFGEYGYDDKLEGRSKEGYRKIDFGQDIFLIASPEQFKINKKDTGEFYSYSDLSDKGKEKLDNDCSDVVGQNGKKVFEPCDTAYVDEKCITKILSKLKIKEKNICTGADDVNKVTAGGTGVKFGNSKCVSADGVGCKDICPSTGDQKFDDKINVTNASGLQIEGPKTIGLWYFTNDRDLISIDESNLDKKKPWPPAQCDSTKPTGGVCTPEVQTYVWFLTWNINKKGYEIFIPRIPTEENLGVFDFNRLPKKLISAEEGSSLNVLGKSLKTIQPYKEFYRGLQVGIIKQDLHTVYKIRAQPTEDVNFTDFLNKITIELGDEWSYDIKSCTGSSCYDSVEKKWKVAFGDAFALGTPCSEYRQGDESRDYAKKRENLKVMRVFNNFDGDKLLKGHSYEVELRFWSFTSRSGQKTAGTYNVVCQRESGVVEFPNIGQCVTGGGGGKAFGCYREYTRLDDNSLIIIDEGEISPS